MANYITRDEAIDVLQTLVNSDILEEDLEEDIEEIITCIQSEDEGYHIWGADEEAEKLFTSYRTDLITPELEEELNAISDKYSFTPAPYEAE